MLTPTSSSKLNQMIDMENTNKEGNQEHKLTKNTRVLSTK